ncbi:seryl-tRNA synthetase [Aciduliprofundum sp. MAR08-339]|uniref:serine--tRNA ligase n=1 Tax=Aciduliprofundum sp. (strain MAR08-339) TaxID=673860 RepID=UPI0002A4AA66|nr:seryl-tRNA synthetase [Aciduliprofundum sp. MAR08-339]
MIDIKIIRTNPDAIREHLRKRFEDPGVVDEILKYDRMWRESLKEIEALRHERNEKSVEIGKMKKSGGDIGPLKERMKEINARIKELEEKVQQYKEKRDYLLMRLPNILMEDTPVCENEENSPVLRVWGRAKILDGTLENFRRWAPNMDFEIVENRPESHVDILDKYDLADIERAGKVAGARFYYLKNKLVLLELALIRFALDIMVEKGYTPVSPPLMIRREAMEGVTDFSAFEEMIYKIDGEDLYMIATAEHPLVAMHMKEILEEKDLPIKYVGISPCFRKEAGAHGKDTKGIFRVHNFYKVEQVIFSKPEESPSLMEELVGNAEEIIQKLELPYRVINICSGELGAVAAKKYDIEVWMPAQQKFREVVSCSNCLEYQSRRLKIRYRHKGEMKFVHTLNSTALATTRIMVAIIENFQEDKGIRIPKALVPYTGFEYIEF